MKEKLEKVTDEKRVEVDDEVQKEIEEAIQQNGQHITVITIIRFPACVLESAATYS